jgi:hypothetical protein
MGRTLVCPAHVQAKVRPISFDEELDNTLFNQQEKHRAEKDRGDITINANRR